MKDLLRNVGNIDRQADGAKSQGIRVDTKRPETILPVNKGMNFWPFNKSIHI